jgi:uncharacterized protein (TIGR02147 family)
MRKTATLLQQPSIYAYENFREYLRDYYTYEKQYSASFSYRSFSALAGFKSPNFLKLVIDGERNLTLSSIKKVSQALRLSQQESEFFGHLVVLNQASNSGERSRHLHALYKSKVFRDLYPLKLAELEFYEQWYSIPIREMIGSPDFQENPDWIANKLRGKISAHQARMAIENMLTLGVIRRSERGNLEQTQKNVTTGSEVQSAVVAQFHKQMMAFAADSIDEVKRYERDISGSTLLISEKTFQHLKNLVQEFRRSLLAEAEESVGDNQAVYQVNFQIFPLTEVLRETSIEARSQKEKICKNT